MSWHMQGPAGRGAWVANVRGELWGVPQAGLSHELGKELVFTFILICRGRCFENTVNMCH